MIHIDLWDDTYDQFDLGAPRPDCPTCGKQEYEFLTAEAGARTTSLCGRDAVQVSVQGDAGRRHVARGPGRANALGGATDVRQNEFLLRAKIDDHEFTVFPDGRAIIKGTQNEAEAATLYARYIGM